MTGPGLRGCLAAAEERTGFPHRPRQARVDERDVDVLSGAALPAVQFRGEDRIDGSRTGGDVVDGDAHLGGLAVRLPRHAQEPSDALRHDVETRPVPVRAGLTETADRAVQDVVADGPDRGVV